MIPVIKYNDKTLVYTGDLIPTVAHIPLIWNMSYDIESLKTIDEKEKLLKKALEENYILVFQHDEHVECCTLEMTSKGIQGKEKFDFSEIVIFDLIINITITVWQILFMRNLFRLKRTQQITGFLQKIM